MYYRQVKHQQQKMQANFLYNVRRSNQEINKTKIRSLRTSYLKARKFPD